MSTIYLCGPIQGCTDTESHGWRDRIQKDYPMYTYLDPMVRDYRGREDDSFAEIVELDKLDISESDILLVNWPGDKPSAGTSMEIIWGWLTDKLVVTVVNPKVKLSPWIKYHSHAIFTDWDEAMDFIFFHQSKRKWREKQDPHWVKFEITPVDGANDPFDRLNRTVNNTLQGQKANNEYRHAG